MKNIKIAIAIALSIILVACGEARQHEASMSETSADSIGLATSKETLSEDEASTVNSNISSSAAVENKKDTVHKFVRTANLKFKVKSVIASTYSIENITAQQAGFVTYTNLASTIDYTTSTAINADSTLETTFFTVVNNIIIRVPNTKLDTTLKLIAKNIDYLDYRIIEAEDVALQLLSNNLTQHRVAKSEQRLTNAIDNRGKKLQETTAAEELLLNKQEQADDAKVANLTLKDKINFSTITLEIYQRQSIKRDVVCNYKNINAYEPSLASKILDAVKYGWNIIVHIILFLIEIWSILLIAALAFLAYRKYSSK